MARWEACKDPSLSLDEFKGQPCWMGNDLAAQTDLASRIKIFQEMQKNDDGVMVRHYFVFGHHYCPMDKIFDEDHPHNQRWFLEEKLTAVPGPEIQLPIIQADIEREIKEFDIQRIAFDPWSALQMQQELATQFGEDVDNIILSVPQTVQYLSPPMKELDAAMLAGRIHHDGDPVLTWALSCLVARVDANDNVFPRKLENGKDKIDPATALITGLNPAMAGEIKRRRYTPAVIGYL